MRKRTVRIAALILTMIMIFCVLPVQAEETDITEMEIISEEEASELDFLSATVLSGSCGIDVRWELDETGTLTISGTGEMTDFFMQDPPYFAYRDSVS